MAKDYAKNRSSGASRGNGNRGAAARRGGSGGGKSGGNGPGLLVGLMLGLAIGAAGIGWVWINRPAKPSQLAPGSAASAKAGKPTTPDIASPGQYLIQVGAYKTRDEAERSRASLALLGVESKIEQVTIDQSESWFRVRIGPQASLTQAQDILQRLDDNGIKGMLVKVKAG